MNEIFHEAAIDEFIEKAEKYDKIVNLLFEQLKNQLDLDEPQKDDLWKLIPLYLEDMCRTGHYYIVDNLLQFADERGINLWYIEDDE